MRAELQVEGWNTLPPPRARSRGGFRGCHVSPRYSAEAPEESAMVA